MIQPIRITEADGDLLVRDSLLLAFFCKRPAAELLSVFSEVFERWLAQTPAEAKLWACIGENADTFKPVSARSMSRARAQFDAQKASSREISSVEIGGPQQINPDHQFVFTAAQDISDAGPITNRLEVRMPSEAVAGADVESVVDFARFIAERIPYDSGYGSLALAWGVDSQTHGFAKAARGLAFRHPGFDMPDNESVRFNLDKKLHGAYWLTFVGPEALAQLGGSDALRAKLDPAITMEHVGVGVMLRAGERPEAGDVNRADNLPLVRLLAKVLEPVTLFGTNDLDHLFAEEEERARWERRHLDGVEP